MMSKNPPGNQAAGPSSAPAKRNWLLARGRWLLVSLILLTAGSLSLTLVLFVRAIPAASPVDARPDEESLPGRLVTILDGSLQLEHSTTLENPRSILDEASLRLNAKDRIWVNGAFAHHEALPAWTVPAHNIRIRRAISLAIIDDGNSSTILTAAETVGEALSEAGLRLFPTDKLEPPPESAIDGPLTIRIKRAIPLILTVDGVDIEARSQAASVAEALAELNAPLYGLDYSLPPGDAPVTENMRIEIVRVTEEIISESEVIKREIQYRPDANLNLDETALVQAGSDGEREIRYRARFENGSEVSREHSETVEITAPVARIIAYGTRAGQLGTVQTPDGPRAYWRRLCVYVTSYNPTSNGGNLNTATGADLAKGIIAAKPHIIPYYTQVYVPGYGNGVIRDTGGGPSGTDYWIDLGYSEHDYARWRKYSYVYLLGSPPAKTPPQLPAWSPASHYPGSCA